MRNSIIKISFLCIIFTICSLCLMSKEASAFSVTNLTFVDGLDVRWGWRFYSGTSANEGGAAGEWQATAEGSTTIGYFINPWAQSMVTGTYSGLSSTLDTYRAAWLIDQFSVGLGRNWQPSGYSGYSMTDGRTALAFAIYEVCMSEDTDLSLSDGNFYILPVTADDPAPTRALTLGQAYLNALSAASLNLAYLDNNYDVIAADQTNPNWTGGYGYANLVVPTQGPSAVPEPASLSLLGLGLLGLVFKRKKTR